MSNYPKEFGPRSPEALAKLKTAVATTAGVHSVSVSVPNASGQKSGAFQCVVSAPSQALAEDMSLYGASGVGVGSEAVRDYLGQQLVRGKGFKLPQFPVWTNHVVKGLYCGVSGVVRHSSSYEVTYSVPDGLGFGEAGGTMTVSVHTTAYGRRLWLGPGPRFFEDRCAFVDVPMATAGHMASVSLFSSWNENKQGMQQYEEGDLYFSFGLLQTDCYFLDSDGKYRVVSLHNVPGEKDAWGLPKQAYEVISVALDKPRQKAEILAAERYALKPPTIEGAGASNVGVSELVALGGGRIGCVVGVHPWARRLFGSYADVALHLGKERDTVPTLESLVEFKSSKGALYFAVSDNNGRSWSFQRLSVLDTEVPAWDGYSSNGAQGADYLTSQPLLGRCMYRAQGWGVYDSEAQLYNNYDLLFPAPDRAGSWDSKCLARVVTATNMSHAFALSEDVWMLVVPMLDDRIYNNQPQDYVRWRCLALRTNNRGATWSEVRSPFSDLAAAFPSDDDRGYALKATVLRDGVALLKFYRAYGRPGDPQAVRDQVRELRFAITEDYGTTWREVVPTGLPSLDPTKLGSLLVVRPGVLAVPAWDGAESVYRVFLSKDDGLTWTAGAKLAEGKFRAMDEVTTVDGSSGGSTPKNFTYLHPLLDKAGRPAKVNAGAPWLHDATRKLRGAP